MAKYVIFGCGPAGIYTAWRLVTSGKVGKADEMALYDWAAYDFSQEYPGTRAPCGRICSYPYGNREGNSYVEVGGMRYIEWDGTLQGSGHRLVTTAIKELGLNGETEPFNTTHDPLFYLRQKHFYSKEISPENPAPYNADHGLAEQPPDAAFAYLSKKALGREQPNTRSKQCRFYHNGELPADFQSSAFAPGDAIKNIGYWNLMFDQLGSEGYRYAAAGGGYQSNVINWNSADALIYNSEFAPGGTFKTLKTGYSSLFSAMFQGTIDECRKRGISISYHPERRLRSVFLARKEAQQVSFTVAARSAPFVTTGTGTADYAFLAMPPGALDLVAEATRYSDADIVDVLNHEKVALYRDAVIEQPSYKVAMFFDHPWWVSADYPPKLKDKSVFGPTITDTPLRQIYYFGNNGTNEEKPVYALLASYDDEQYVRFWREMELDVTQTRRTPPSWKTEPLKGPMPAPISMVNMLREQLAQVHFKAGATKEQVPEPLETVFMDWSQKPFSAGYHGWAPHYDIDDVMQKIRKPTQLIDEADAELYVVGSAYSNDQAWVEGAFCTAESVLTDFLHLEPIINPDHYPFICRGANNGD